MDENNAEELKKQSDEYLAGWKRAKADLINLESQVARERQEWVQFATARCLERLLPVSDTLHAALIHNPQLAEVVRKFDDYLRGEGLTEIQAEGLYDPSVHEVIGREKREGATSDTILTVAQRGYKLHERVLRPTKVIVAE